MHRGYSWAAWLVVGATGLLLPVEIVEIIRHVKLGRVVIFIVNAAIVVYLARGAWHAHQQHRAVQRVVQG